MDKDNTTRPVNQQEPPTITRKIGRTTYDVQIHFSDTSKETMTDKIMRLIKNDCENARFD